MTVANKMTGIRMIFLRVLIVLFAFIFTHVNAAMAQERSQTAGLIRQAYQSIPHKQTTFSPERSNLSEDEIAALDQIFYQVDRAVVTRVKALSMFKSDRNALKGEEWYQDKSKDILSELNAIKAPWKLIAVKMLIESAIKEQGNYFSDWAKALERNEAYKYRVAEGINWKSQRNIQSSNQKLLQAYQELMRLFPNESEKNKEAFFDHLCALDFV